MEQEILNIIFMTYFSFKICESRRRLKWSLVYLKIKSLELINWLWRWVIVYIIKSCTAIPYRVNTGPELGFPCKFFPNREKLVFITGIPANGNRFFPVRKSTQGKPCFHYRDGFAVYLCNCQNCKALHHILMKMWEE